MIFVLGTAYVFLSLDQRYQLASTVRRFFFFSPLARGLRAHRAFLDGWGESGGAGKPQSEANLPALVSA